MNLLILDNKGETFDRYTIVNLKDGEMKVLAFSFEV